MIHNIYATPIYLSKIDLNSIIENRVSLIRSTYDISNPWNDGTYTSFKFGNSPKDKIKHFNDLPLFIECISTEIKKYISEIGGKNIKFTIDESWVNFTEKNQYQHFHMHAKYDITGIYYYKASENGYLQLENPVAVADYSKFPNNIISTSPICIQPKTGTLVLFPAWLRHAVYNFSFF